MRFVLQVEKLLRSLPAHAVNEAVREVGGEVVRIWIGKGADGTAETFDVRSMDGVYGAGARLEREGGGVAVLVERELWDATGGLPVSPLVPDLRYAFTAWARGAGERLGRGKLAAFIDWDGGVEDELKALATEAVGAARTEWGIGTLWAGGPALEMELALTNLDSLRRAQVWNGVVVEWWLGVRNSEVWRRAKEGALPYWAQLIAAQTVTQEASGLRDERVGNGTRTERSEAAELRRAVEERIGKRARIAYFPLSSLRAGSEIELYRFSRLARRNGFETILCLPERCRKDGPGLEVLAQADGVQVVWLEYEGTAHPEISLTEKLERQTAALAEWMRTERIRLVHSANFLPAVGMAARRAGVPHVTSVFQHHREPDFDWSPPRGVPRHCDVIHSDSLKFARAWSGWLRVPSFAMRAPVPPEFFSVGAERLERGTCGRGPDDAAADGAPLRLAVIGVYHLRKGQLVAIEALADVLAARPEARAELWLYGLTGADENYEAHMAAASTVARDRTSGRMSVNMSGFREDLPELLRETDVFVLSSVNESFPQVLLESMAAGVGSVCFPVDGVPELLRDGETGVLARGTDKVALADALGQYFDMPRETRCSLIRRAYEVALEECREEVCEVGLLRGYCEAAERGIPGGVSTRIVEDATTAGSDSFGAGNSGTSGDRISLAPHGVERNARVPGDPAFRAVKMRVQANVRCAEVAAVKLRFGTHQQQPHGTVRVRIVDEAGKEAARGEIDAARLRDNQLAEVRVCSANGQHEPGRSARELIVEYRPAEGTKPASLSVYHYGRRETLRGKIARKWFGAAEEVWGIDGELILTAGNSDESL